MSRLSRHQLSRPSLLPTAVLALFDRHALRDALCDVQRETELAPTPLDGTLEMLDVLDALGGEAMNTLHLAGSDLALAVDRDLHTSSAWLASALFDSMDRTRGAA